jgi:membrane protein DedA with SNARE-associated domain
MPILGWFLVFTVLDSVIWNAMLIGLGWALGAQWTLVEQYARIVEYVVPALVALAIAWFLWRRLRIRG